MEEFQRVIENILSRPSGPLSLRFVMQPIVSCLLAIRAGLKDAREGQPPYLWSVVSDPSARRRLLQSWWRDAGRLSLMALGLDTIYQLVEFRWIYPLEALIVAFFLAVVPYALIRGPVTRIARSRPVVRNSRA